MILSKLMVKRIVMSFVGVALCGVSVGFFNVAAFGVDPFQSFAQGLHIPFARWLTYGAFYAVLSAALLVADLFLDRRYIRIATFFNVFLMGYIIDWTTALLTKLLPAPPTAARLGILVFALVLTCFAASLYYTGNLGVSVYDAIPLSLADRKLRLAGKVLPFKFVRIICDCVCVAVGACFGKLPGISTIVTALFMGPFIEWFNVHVARPMLRSKEKKQPQACGSGMDEE